MFECHMPAWGCPVGELFKNETRNYTVVKNHVAECPDCGPDESLRKWLELRDRRNSGLCSKGILDMAIRLERACSRKKGQLLGKRVDPLLVNQFIVRQGMFPGEVALHADRLSNGELLEAVCWTWTVWTHERDGTGSPRGGGYKVRTPNSDFRASPWTDEMGRWYGGPGRGAGFEAMVRMAARTFDAGTGWPDPEALIRTIVVGEVMLG